MIRAGAGLKIKQARLRAEMKQYTLGLQLGGIGNPKSAQREVHRMESDPTYARIDRVMAAAGVLGISLEDVIAFVTDEEPGEPPAANG